MKIIGFLEKRGARITIFKEKNRYIFHDEKTFNVFPTKSDFEKYIYQNKYKFVGVKNG